MPTEHDFFTFIYSRQLIWHKRFVLKQQPPWTDDPILRTFKFINMYRELDRCTQYLLNALDGVKNRDKILINTLFYRFFNLDNLYEDLGITPFDTLTPDFAEQLTKKFTELKTTRPIFNNAYLICSGGKGVKHANILRTLASLDIPALIRKMDESKTPEESFSVLASLPMVGPFLACEFWTDLTYFDFFKQHWNDDDFVNIGPGAKWGLEIMYGKLSMRESQEKLRHLHLIQREILPTIHEKIGQTLSWKDIAYKNAYSNHPFLSLTNVEGALCEFRKYWRLKHGEGRRRYYTPST